MIFIGIFKFCQKNSKNTQKTRRKALFCIKKVWFSSVFFLPSMVFLVFFECFLSVFWVFFEKMRFLSCFSIFPKVKKSPKKSRKVQKRLRKSVIRMSFWRKVKKKVCFLSCFWAICDFLRYFLVCFFEKSDFLRHF